MTVIDRDGVALFYDDVGSGAPPLVMLHCWGGDHRYLAPQTEYFCHRHRVISPDLRGFGASARPRQAYTMAGYADDVAWLCDQLALERPVLIGHSMGGTIALTAAARDPDRYAAIVILEALVVAPPGMVDAFRPVLDGVRSPAWADTMRNVTDLLTGPHFDPRDRERMRAHMVTNDPHVLASSQEDLLAQDTAALAARCTVPVLYVASPTWYTDVARFRALCPQLETAQLVGCGHNFPLEVPAQTNAVVDRFLHLLP